MKTHYCTATSLDGFIADEQHSLAWLFQLGSDPAVDEHDEAFVAQTGALVMGSSTYEWLLREEIRDYPGRWPYAQPTWAFTSRELPGVPGADVPFVSGPVEPVHAEIAAPLPEGKDLWLIGGGELVGTFLELTPRTSVRLPTRGVGSRTEVSRRGQESGQRSANRSVAATRAALISGSVQACPEVGHITSSASGQARCRSQAVTAGVQRS